MKASEIHELTPEELARALEENRRELFDLRTQAHTGQLENTDRIRQVRRDIARMLTEQSLRARAANA